MANLAKAHLLYVTDTYCIWCWAFGRAVREFALQQADRADVQIVMGNMLRGERVKPLSEVERVLEGTQRVSEVTGVQFGPGYYDTVRRAGTHPESAIVRDSTRAAYAYHAMHALAPERDLDIAHALQKAFYWDGLDLHDPAVVRRVAQSLNLDADQVIARLNDPATQAAAEAGFARRDELNIKGYPTLLLLTPEGPKRLSGATATAQKLTQDFGTLLAGGEIDDDDE